MTRKVSSRMHRAQRFLPVQEPVVIATSKSGVSLSRRLWAHVKLADPVTWISPTLMVVCGAIASGRGQGFDPANPRDLALVALGALMTGPLGTGFSQSINDYFDHELDAINDPDRPIPSGEISLRAAMINWIILGAATLLVSVAFLNIWITLLAVLGLILSVLYSMPPIKLKKNYWLGPPAVGLGYVVMSWFVGHLIFADMTWASAIVAVINGAIATGLIFLNDIKSIDGDRQHGMSSLPVAIGVRPTLLISYALLNLSELALMLLAFFWGHIWVAGFVLLAMIVPVYSQIKLYQEPSHQNFLRFILASNGFVVAIQFMSAFVVGGYLG